MRLVTFQHGSRRALGAVAGDAVVDLQAAYAAHLTEVEGDPNAAEIAAVRIPAAMTAFVAGLEPSWLAAEQALAFGAPSYPLADVRLLAPIAPPIILNSGQNYWDHRDEKPPVEQHDPEFFLKAPLGVIGPDEPVILDPAVTRKLDYEVELGIVIGKPGRHIPRERALDHVFGYTVANDVTARDRQAVPHPEGGFEYRLGPGKNFDTCAPIGPWIVTSDEIPDPQALGLRTYVNEELRQSNSTAKMIWDVATLVSFFSDFYTLQPGVLIESGTPGGTAWASDPEIGGKPYERDDVKRAGYLQPGDVVTVEIDGIGSLTNPIVSPDGAALPARAEAASQTGG
jgi:2-keto-4-pentenoate hydratase/2-oxohepta-3-ene-1,7-dioic acid hydratase in catechol pathway